MTEKTTPEFSRLVPLEELAGGQIRRVIEAGEGERSALAHRFDLYSVDLLTTKFLLQRIPGGPLVRVDGHLVADIVQRCVASLEPVPAHIDETFTEIFGPEGYQVPEGEENPPIPEAYYENGIDLGETAAQNLLLSMDPYPRAADAVAGVRPEGEEDAETRRPFAGLGEALRKQRK